MHMHVDSPWSRSDPFQAPGGVRYNEKSFCSQCSLVDSNCKPILLHNLVQSCSSSMMIAAKLCVDAILP